MRKIAYADISKNADTSATTQKGTYTIVDSAFTVSSGFMLFGSFGDIFISSGRKSAPEQWLPRASPITEYDIDSVRVSRKLGNNCRCQTTWCCTHYISCASWLNRRLIDSVTQTGDFTTLSIARLSFAGLVDNLPFGEVRMSTVKLEDWTCPAGSWPAENYVALLRLKRPASTMWVSSATDGTCNFLVRLVRCNFTVRSLISSASAICLFIRPRTTCSSTSSSRSASAHRTACVIVATARARLLLRGRAPRPAGSHPAIAPWG